MKSRSLKIIWFVLLIILIFFNVLLIDQERKNKVKYNKLLNETVKNNSINNNLLNLLEIYNKVDSLIIDFNTVLYDKENKSYLLTDVVSKDPSLIIWLSINSCSECYKNSLVILNNKLKKINENISNKIIIIAYGFMNNRNFDYFVDDLNLDKRIKVFYVNENIFHYQNILTMNDIPFAFILYGNKISNILLMDKHLDSDLYLDYYSFIIKKYIIMYKTQ